MERQKKLATDEHEWTRIFCLGGQTAKAMNFNVQARFEYHSKSHHSCSSVFIRGYFLFRLFIRVHPRLIQEKSTQAEPPARGGAPSNSNSTTTG